MLEERFSDICQVISATREFFQVSCQIPDKLPDEWLAEFQKRQLTVKIGANHLIVRPYLGREIRVELESEVGSSDKEKWRSQMERLNLTDFSFSTMGFVFGNDKVFDLTTVVRETEKVSQEQIIPKKCPSCKHKLSKDEIENGFCDECGESFWVCSRCDALISEDPSDIDSCPVCKKTYEVITCPDCQEDVWIDEAKCSKCGKEFKISKCPGCRKKFVVSDDLNECPYCQSDIYICPRCQEYIDEDPNDADSCPVCKKTLVVIDCPNCQRNDIYPDSEKCERCGKEFKVGKCPYSDCGKPLILSGNFNTCPYCDNDIQYVSCPNCQEEFYTETN